MNRGDGEGGHEGPGGGSAQGRDPGYDTAARLFHWTTAAMVFILLPVGVVMTSDLVQPWSDTLFVLHKGLGTVLLGVVAARFLWMLVRPGPDGPLPAGSPPAQRRLASLTHGTLYAVLLLQGGSGYVRTVGDGYPVELLDALGLPTLLPEMPGVASVMLLVHRLTAFLLTGLVAAHVAAVVQHTVVQRDGVIRRMWPPVRTRGD